MSGEISFPKAYRQFHRFGLFGSIALPKTTLTYVAARMTDMRYRSAVMENIHAREYELDLPLLRS